MRPSIWSVTDFISFWILPIESLNPSTAPTNEEAAEPIPPINDPKVVKTVYVTPIYEAAFVSSPKIALYVEAVAVVPAEAFIG